MIPLGFGEREDSPRSVRWPKELVKRIEKLAEESRHDFSTTVFHLVKWALDENDRKAEAEARKAAG